MKFKVQIVYAAPSQNHDLVVEVKGSPKGLKLMNAVEKAVEKEMARKAKDESPTFENWKRWNLIDVAE